jgi:streptogramin lyase/DNA-binding CsgD family transcriptional regulator
MIWIGTEYGGLKKLDPQTGTVTHYRSDPSNPATLSHDHVSAIYKDRSGRLWIGTDAGLNRWEPDTGTFTRYRADRDQPFSLSNNLICSIFEDRSGIFWIGTRGGGVNKLDFKKNQFDHYHYNTDDPNGVVVFAVFEDQSGFLWIGSTAGLYKYSAEKDLLAHYRHIPGNPNSLPHDRVRAIKQDSSGKLWIAGYGGLSRMDTQTGTFTNYAAGPNPNSLSNNMVLAICIAQPGTIWLGTLNGLNKMDVEKNRFTRYLVIPGNPESLGAELVKCLYRDRSGVLWAGTLGGGLNRFNSEADTFTHYRYNPDDPNSLSHDFVLCIHEDTAGNMWLGTFGGGLNKFNREDGSFTHYGMKDGISNDVIYGILEDESGSLWLSTNFGLSRFDPVSMKIKNYSAADGLQSNEFNGGAYFKSKSGELLFGGINGFNAFFPENMIDNPHVPPVVITSFLKLNKKAVLPQSITETKELTLSYRDYVFSFEFAVLDYSAPERNKYAYKMEGLDNEWIPTDADKRFASYTTLDPGTYVFRVKGANNDGKWNNRGTSIRIIITPPYWETWWFRVLCILSLALLLYVSHRARMANVTLRLKTEAEMNRIFDKYNISEREREILKLILKGKSNKDVENELYISLKTVKCHVYNIYQKMGVKTRLELIHLIQTSAKKK